MGVFRFLTVLGVGLVSLYAAVVSPAHAYTETGWDPNGAGGCGAIGPNGKFTPTNCQYYLSAWYNIDAFHYSGHHISCDNEYWYSLQYWNYYTYSETAGVGYQAHSAQVVQQAGASPVGGSASNPGYGQSLLSNNGIQSHSAQSTGGCLSSNSPVEPPSGVSVPPPRPRYDFGEWERSHQTKRGDQGEVIRQVKLEEGKTRQVRLVCPGDLQRIGGWEYSVGYAVKEMPDREKMEKTEIKPLPDPFKRGLRFTFQPVNLPYPTVAQLSIKCGALPAR